MEPIIIKQGDGRDLKIYVDPHDTNMVMILNVASEDEETNIIYKENLPAVIQALGEIAGNPISGEDKGRLYAIAASSIRYHEDGTGDIDKATFIERLLKDYIIIKR